MGGIQQKNELPTQGSLEGAKMRNEFLKPHQAALILGVHTNTLRNWVVQGIITERRTPTNHRLFVREEIETLKNQINREK